MSRYSIYYICKDTRSLVIHYHQVCRSFLQVHYLQITTTFKKPLFFEQSNIQAQKHYSSLCLPTLIHDLDPLKILISLLKSPLLLLRLLLMWTNPPFTLRCNPSLTYPKSLLLISSNGHSSNHLKIFTCITVHQTSVLHEPLGWHYPSNSTMVGCHLLYLLPIPINKQYTSRLKYLTAEDYYLYPFVLP